MNWAVHDDEKKQMTISPPPPPLPRALLPASLIVCLASGAIALALGMDASWDLRNYHYYNGWAALHGHVGRDVLVAQIPSFFNPALDVPYAWMAEALPARAVGFLLGMVHGLNFPLLFAIAWHLLQAPPRRGLAAGALALAGMAGAATLSEIGTTFWDDVVSLGVLGAVLILLANWRALAEAAPARAGLLAAAAGLPAGLAFGLKQPEVLFCVGLCAGLLAADWPPARRLWVAFAFGLGVLAGLGIGGGWWMIHLWKAYGNPLFPFFNHVFKSPWGLADPYRDPGFLQHGFWAMLTFGFRFPFDPRLTAETSFQDFRILALLVLVPLAGLAGLARRTAEPLARPGPARWLLASAAVAYGLWVVMFCIYRYLMPLEMLAPLLAVAALGMLPLPRRGLIALALVALLVATTRPADWLRVAWADKAVAVDLPAVAQAEGTLVLLSGHEPLSFLIPAFPPGMKFLRIDSTFTLSEGDTGFRRLFRQTIESWPGPIASLHIGAEEHDVVRKLAEYGLELGPCGDNVTAPIGAAPYRFCPTQRPTSGRLRSP
jgi:hypothetical protein